MEKQRYSSRFFRNADCESLPGQQGVRAEDLNCLSCGCPLYAPGKKRGKCGGSRKYTKTGVKRGIDRAFPRRRENHSRVIARVSDFRAAVRRRDGESK